ncbi:alpha-amylase family protein [Nodosilinea sp. LEGE 06152]|uniref:alpha-amylase n=1 Tax=Nodosilinea sp. LEGE 06152 TaxID=2777966 RepID=UPI001880EE72|nr:alpha-amylase family protein [Nodosilinea sp. LEGE 06152]MBE9158682.1 alpha-amylase family protein [Nodosilinea sp. LEGE 06152]
MWKIVLGALSASGVVGLAVLLNPLALFPAPSVSPLSVQAPASASGIVISEVAAPGAPAPTTPAPTTLVHLFEWTWADIATECETYLGPNGYRAVQISPPQEHIVLPDYGYPWWQRYQPVSYRLESRSGSRAALQDMIHRCRDAGVAVYADAVINHMAGFDSGVGSAGSRFTKYDYPGLYKPEDFNDCHQQVTDYDNAENVTQCELVGLADLNTGSAKVQATLVDYMSELVEMGVAGFRIDAAKHIRNEELGEILAQLRDRHPEVNLYIYQEVIDPGTEAIRKQDYYDSGNVLDFKYGRFVGLAFLGLEGQTLANLQTLGEGWGLAPSAQAVVFTDNHDKQRGHGGGGDYLTYKNGDLYALANVFMLAFPYGKPQVMSSFAFDNSEQGPPTYANGITQPVYQGEASNCFEAWVCEHRWPAIAGMVGFRNAVEPVAEVTDWWSNNANQIAFGRGNRGFVAINREAQPLTHRFQTQLPPGRYCNVAQGGLAANGKVCANDAEVILVNRAGQFTATLPAMSALAIHVEAKLTRLF